MKAKTKSPRQSSGAHIIGRRGFAKISAVEGIVLGREMEAEFREFDRQRLSMEERRKALLHKYGRKA